MPMFLASAAFTLVSMLSVPGIPLPTPEPAPEPAQESSEVQLSGSTSAADGILRRGCRRYSYSYTVSTPHDEWTLETSVFDRRGKSVAAGVLFGTSDPRTGVYEYDLCRWATKPGLFTIQGRLVSHDNDDKTVLELPESQFRLRLRR